MSSVAEDQIKNEETLSQQEVAHRAWEDSQTRMFSKMVGLMLSRPAIDVTKDLTNGDVLIKLVEKLSGKSLNIPLSDSGLAASSSSSSFSASSSSGPPATENRLKVIGRINKLLDFLQAEKVPITTSAQNIFEADIKLTLGFIWTLIYHYQISNKKKILEWVSGLAAPLGVPVTNFTSSWADGRALAILVLALAKKMEEDIPLVWGPELLELPATRRIEISLAASHQLGIPALLETSDVDTPRPDERIILTYVSYFYNSFVHGITLRPAPPPKEPEPEPVVVVDDTELRRLRQKVKKLKAKLKAEKTEKDELLERTQTEISEITMCYDSLMRKFTATTEELQKNADKLNELNRKFALSRESTVSAVPPPVSDVTLVRVAVAGSAKIWKASCDAMYHALVLFNRVVRARLLASEGYEVKYEAEVFTIAFSTALSAAHFSVSVQSELAVQEWPPELNSIPDCALEQDAEEQPIFVGLRAAISLHTGDPILDKDPSSGKHFYAGPVFNALLSISSVCQGGQTLLSADTQAAIKDQLEQLGEPNCTHLGEVSFPDLDESLHLYQLLPVYLSNRKFKPLASPEKLNAVMVGLETELSMLEQENNALRSALGRLHTQMQDNQGKLSSFSSWLRTTTTRSKTGPANGKSQLDKEIANLLRDQSRLEQEMKSSDTQREELERSLVTLRRTLATVEKAHHVLQKRYSALEEEHAQCGLHPPPPPPEPEPERALIYTGAPKENMVKAPREILNLLKAHPSLELNPDPERLGNWLVGDHSYSLRDIHKGNIDPDDLIANKKEREKLRKKEKEKDKGDSGSRVSTRKQRPQRPKSMFFQRRVTLGAVNRSTTTREGSSGAIPASTSSQEIASVSASTSAGVLDDHHSSSSSSKKHRRKTERS